MEWGGETRVREINGKTLETGKGLIEWKEPEKHWKEGRANERDAAQVLFPSSCCYCDHTRLLERHSRNATVTAKPANTFYPLVLQLPLFPWEKTPSTYSDQQPQPPIKLATCQLPENLVYQLHHSRTTTITTWQLILPPTTSTAIAFYYWFWLGEPRIEAANSRLLDSPLYHPRHSRVTININAAAATSRLLDNPSYLDLV